MSAPFLLRTGPGLLARQGQGVGIIDQFPEPLTSQPQQSGSVSDGSTGQRGPTGPGSTVPGPTGPPSTIPGPTGPTGRSVTGPTGRTGPTGPASTVPGPTGAPSTVPGPTGPKGSFVKNKLGIYEFACIEGTRPWFVDIASIDKHSESPKFNAAVTGEKVTFKSECGGFRMTFAVRNEFPDWHMPEGTDDQRNHSVAMWNKEYLKA